ncbi:MAG: penicillin-binding protein [Fibromonadaceae bacterium]|jgi:membrane peptidoglycan carboxypeptidase|nr:penicillin-binding protein [Fibromonadaceae bacterium]
MWKGLSKFFRRKIFIVLLILLAVFAIAATSAYVYVFTVIPDKDPTGKFTRENILRNLSGETRVFYSDGVSVVGSFFDTNRRLYVPYDSIPQTLIDAIISAEDAKFWEHKGFDKSGFTRAMLNNLKNRNFRQGGSTISQQTVKNVFGREEKSVKAKWEELVDALRLEKRFSKKDILEFYLNQFQVYGSGRGASIAAIYFFNKPLSELSLEESAFIAASVKGPFNYDPRVQKTEERAKLALERGQTRTRYVLRRMLENGYINQDVHDSAQVPELNYGEFRFSTSFIMDKVDRELSDEFYERVFRAFGIEDWRRAQMKIVTTLDADLQKNAENAIRENLSNLQNRIGADSANPLQGALVALKSGMVVAAQSGSNNMGFDRVFIARRQFGSTWKPFLFSLALKYGWDSLDELENEYNLFTYGGTVYFPRSDYTDKPPLSSMAWTAARSENIASIWLLERLLDKLPISDLRKFAEENLIDTSITASARNEIALEKAKRTLTADWLLEGRFEAARALQALKYNYNQSEVEKQRRFPDRVALLRHNYEYYNRHTANFGDYEIFENNELFPNFTYLDFIQVKELFEQNRKSPLHADDTFLWPELRKKIAMKKLAHFIRSIGINRELKEVMSMPFGVNEATMAEMTVAYQSILSGKLYKCRDGNWGEPCIIKEIRDNKNDLIFRNEIDSTSILTERETLPMQAMLRAVFKYGTAASAHSRISTTYSGARYPFPAVGKTGTTNENRTVSFCGAMPMDSLLTICSYVGFDDNERLRGPRGSLSGASGALPQWSAFAARALAANRSGKVFGEKIDYINAIAHNEVQLPRMPPSIEVDRKSGLPFKADSLSEATGAKPALFPAF